jgi:hypothetical protein
MLRIISICLLSAVALTGCASRGSEFLGKWVNTQNPNDTFQVTRNGDEYLIVSQNPLLSKIADICLTREMLEEADPQLL